ncbi:3-oxoacyl-[acyl-carrier-protein] synthase 2 [Moritella viscosa]|uniref:hypothetical protein n=1 Tax=Moritella viscosa TaxID=80854 RepID=UPI00091FA3BC|nr:hypothetical protein [Moritella viscosa]SGZ09787.1 3-oxoacyl-[acyl-carrier-protein] synthase 2 [Moritella viscosa]
MKANLPFRLMKRNRIALAIDKAILDNYEKTNKYHFIQKSIPELADKPKPTAYKYISKALYVNGIQPPISLQGHETKTVLGASGEALTELILPPEDELRSNNRGYDLDYDDAYIEVKSTVEDRVSLTNIQYLTANYVVIHVYNKYSDDYRFTYLIPLKILRAIKGTKSGNVTINLYKEKWVRLFQVTLLRLSLFFKARQMYMHGNANSLVEIRYKTLLNKDISLQGVHVSSLFTRHTRCGSWKWERRYAYYEYFQNRHPNWLYEHNCLANVYNLGLYAVYRDNMWKRRTLL